MKQIKTYLVSSLLLVALLLLIIIFRSILAQYVITPLAAIGQAAWQMISSIDQTIYWIFLVAICISMTIRIIPKKKKDQTSSAYRYNYKPPNQYQHWLTTFKDSELGPNEREFLRQNLQELYEGFIADQSQLESYPEGSTLPPAAKQFLFNQAGKPKTIAYILPKKLRRLAGSYFYKDHTSIDELLTWMETHLEIYYGD